MDMFKCDCCGLCCMKVACSTLYYVLDRGDGVCKYFNCETKLCNIYQNRPIMCNVDKAYELYFKEKMAEDEYYKKNYEACEKLKKEGINKCI